MGFETEFDYISPYSGSDSVSDETIDNSSFITLTDEGGEENVFSPDAIEINDFEEIIPDDEYSEVSTEINIPEIAIPEESIPEEAVPEEAVPEDAIPVEVVPEETNPEKVEENFENWDSVKTGSAAIIGSPVSSPGSTSSEVNQGEKQTENHNNGSDPLAGRTLNNIYKLLDERIPTKSESESESESEEQVSFSETEITLSDIHDQINILNQYESEQIGILTEIRDNNIVSNNNGYYLDSFQIAIMSAIYGSILIFLLFRNIK